MLNDLNTIKATKYNILIKWLKEQLENNNKIKKEDLELLLLSLDVEIEHKWKNG